MDLGVAGKVALVTGATRGIGAATAKLLLQEGACVYGTGRSAESAAAAEQQFAFASDNIVLAGADADDPETPARIVKAAISRFGRLDLIVNNAASFGPRPMGQLQRSDWFDLAGQKLATASAIIMAARDELSARSGAVVNISGKAGVVPAGDTPHVGAVNAGVVAMTRFYASRLAKYGIRVNAVSPGDTNTDRREGRIAQLELEGMTRQEAEKLLLANLPLSRTVEPAEVAAVIVALCSTPFQSVTGVNIVVDGGSHLQGSVQQ